MQKISLFTVFVFFFIGCKNNKINIAKVKLKETEPVVTDTVRVQEIIKIKDTLFLDKQELDINYDTDFSDWKNDEIDLSQYSFLKRIKDTLKITVRDSTIVFVNEYFDEIKQNYEAASFIVARVYPSYSIVELQAISYEYSYHLLADLKTGDTIFSYGQPMFSDNSEYIFTSNVDLEVGYDDNGYQLIKLDSLGFTNIKTVELKNWGIEKASWISSDSIMYSKVTLNEDYKLDSENKKMKVK